MRRRTPPRDKTLLPISRRFPFFKTVSHSVSGENAEKGEKVAPRWSHGGCVGCRAELAAERPRRSQRGLEQLLLAPDAASRHRRADVARQEHSGGAAPRCGGRGDGRFSIADAFA